MQKRRRAVLAVMAPMALLLVGEGACQPAASETSGTRDAGADHEAPPLFASVDPPAVAPPDYQPYPAGFVPAAKQLETKALAGDVAATLELFDWIQSGDGVPDDASRAAALAARACARSVHDACGRLGMLYLRGEGVVKNTAHAIKLLDAACEKGSAWSCARIGEERLFATRVPVNLVKGVEQLNVGCDKGSIYACDALLRAMQHKVIPKKDVGRLVDKRFNAAEVGCKKERRFYDCEEWRVAGLRASGEDSVGSKNSPKEDEEYASRPGQEISGEALCKAGDYHACTRLEDQTLFDSWRVACTKGDSRACNATLLGELIAPMCGKGDCQACAEVLSDLKAEPGQPSLVAIVDRGCAMGCVESCEAAIKLHPPPPPPKDTVEEREKKEIDKEKYKWLRIACEAGSGASCVTLGQEIHYGRSDNDLVAKGCPDAPRFFSHIDLSAKACLLTADALRNGYRPDLERAAVLYERACRADGASGYGVAGCRGVGLLLESRVHPDLDQALAYYAASCSMSDWESCFRARELVQRGVPADPEARKRLHKKLTSRLFGDVTDGGPWK